jgi:hypothetical protein
MQSHLSISVVSFEQDFAGQNSYAYAKLQVASTTKIVDNNFLAIFNSSFNSSKAYRPNRPARGRFNEMYVRFFCFLLMILPTTYSFVVNYAPRFRSSEKCSCPRFNDACDWKELFASKSSRAIIVRQSAADTPGESSDPDLVEISVDELASLLQNAGVKQATNTPADSELSSFLASPQAKEMMEAMAKQVTGGPGGVMSAAAALPFFGTGDPGKPLRKSAAEGDSAGVQRALDSAVWVSSHLAALLRTRSQSNITIKTAESYAVNPFFLPFVTSSEAMF